MNLRLLLLMIAKCLFIIISPLEIKMEKISFCFAVFVFFVSLKGIAQHEQDYHDVTTERPSVGIVGGLSGFKSNFIEIGVGYQPWEVKGNYVYFPFAGFIAMYEVEPMRKVYGTSLNAWYLAGFFSCGLSANRYSDHTNDTYGIKPMVGISFLRIGVMYGYNFFLNKNSITDLRHNTFTIKYYLPLWKKK
jgi:hypothetical protein